jgi:hypothetical protein
MQVTGLRPEELSMALAYEVEPFSGIPAAEAELEYTPVVDSDPAVRVYDVAVRRRRKRASSGGERWLLPLLAAGCAAILLAGADFVCTSARLRTLKREVSARAALQARLDSIRNPAKAARSEACMIRERREAAARAQTEAAKARVAYADALDAIAAACGERAVISSIDGNAFTIGLAGVAVTASAAADTFVALTEAAATRGWRLVTGPISVRTPGLTAEFKCELSHD